MKIAPPSKFIRSSGTIYRSCCGSAPNITYAQGCGQPSFKTRSKAYIASATGESNPQFEPFNSFAIRKPDCCELTIITDCGTIVMPQDMHDFSSCDYYTDVVFSSISLEANPPECLETVSIFVAGSIIEEVPPDEIELCPVVLYPDSYNPAAMKPCCPEGET